MKTCKIRGFKKKLSKIDNWVNYNKNLNLDFLKENNCEYVEFLVSPWCDIHIGKSDFPQPKGLARKKLIEGLYEIYHTWKKELDKLGEEFYLKIWIFPHNLSRSQVVCAINDKIELYNNVFNKSNTKKVLSQFPNQLSNLNWETYLDELILYKSEFSDPDIYESKEDFEEDQRYLAKKIKEPHKVFQVNGDTQYIFPNGYILVGG